jgi:hypothetical protein
LQLYNAAKELPCRHMQAAAYQRRGSRYRYPARPGRLHSEIAQDARPFPKGVLLLEMLADDAAPEKGNRKPDGCQALSRDFDDRHRPFLLAATH